MITSPLTPGFYSRVNQLLLQVIVDQHARMLRREDDAYEALTTLGKGRGEKRARYIEYMAGRGL